MSKEITKETCKGILGFTVIKSGVCPKCKKKVKSLDELIDHAKCFKGE